MAKLKSAKNDFQTSMLPHTRKEIFWDVLKLHWKQFLSYGALMLLFTLTFHLLAINQDIFQLNLLADLAKRQQMLSPEEYATYEQQATVQYLSMVNTRGLLNVVSFLILSIGLSGFTRVIRQYCWMENVYFKGDFAKGIKQNGKHVALLALLVGIVNALVVYAGNLASVTESQAMAVVLIIPVALAVIVGIPTVAYAMVSISIYQYTFWGHVKLGLMLASKRPFKTLLAMVCCLVPFALALVPNIYCHIFGRVIGSLVSPIVLLGWYLFALNQFDKFVNEQKFPHLVGKGISPLQPTEQGQTQAEQDTTEIE